MFFLLLDVATALPLIGIIYFIFSSGFLSAYMMKVIVSSADGESAPPDWPDFTDWWLNIVRPLRLVTGTFLLAVLPCLALFLYSYHYGAVVPRPLFWIFGICGIVYLPMALLAVAMYQSLAALNPFFVARAIIHVGSGYLITCAILTIAVIGGFLVKSASGNVPFAGFLLSGILGLYFMMIEMRLIALIYHNNVSRLRWFDEAGEG